MCLANLQIRIRLILSRFLPFFVFAFAITPKGSKAQNPDDSIAVVRALLNKWVSEAGGKQLELFALFGGKCCSRPEPADSATTAAKRRIIAAAAGGRFRIVDRTADNISPAEKRNLLVRLRELYGGHTITTFAPCDNTSTIEALSGSPFLGTKDHVDVRVGRCQLSRSRLL
jgi:hypothetical protein